MLTYENVNKLLKGKEKFLMGWLKATLIYIYIYIYIYMYNIQYIIYIMYNIYNESTIQGKR